MTPFSPEPPSLVAADILVTGMVQGVGYRFFTQRAAEELCLSGWVRNLSDGRVQAEVEGPRPRVEELLARLRVGPSLSSVTDVAVTWKAASGAARGFLVKP
jgi:acylphosphatase